LQFELNLEDNIFSLYSKLKNKTYCHSNYTSFCIKDPKLRKIHKAIVEDRVLHHAIFRILYPIFDKYFIFDSCSCRNKLAISMWTRGDNGCCMRDSCRNLFLLPFASSDQKLSKTDASEMW